jgi:amino acid permease
MLIKLFIKSISGVKVAIYGERIYWLSSAAYQIALKFSSLKNICYLGAASEDQESWSS